MSKWMLGFAAATLVAGAGLSAETKTVSGVLVDMMCNTKQGTEKDGKMVIAITTNTLAR